MVAELAGRGARILDCCAAPGGKTAILAENNPQAEITACDISEARLNTMRRNFARNPSTAKIHCVLADATALPFPRTISISSCATRHAAAPERWRAIRRSSCGLPRATSATAGAADRDPALRLSRVALRGAAGLLHLLAGAGGERDGGADVSGIGADCTIARCGRTPHAMEAERSLHRDGAQLLRETALA